jgi:carbamoylphosphate synthase large subunit
VECARIQNAIAEHLGVQDSHLFFDFVNEGGRFKLNLITVNPRHNQSFLLHSEVGINKVDVLSKMYDYVKSYKEKESSYTVQWTSREDKELQTSYFRAKNMYDALDKLYYGRDVNALTVYSIVLNPVA